MVEAEEPHTLERPVRLQHELRAYRRIHVLAFVYRLDCRLR